MSSEEHDARIALYHRVFLENEDGQKVLQDIINKEHFTMAEIDPVRRIARQELIQEILMLARAGGDEDGVGAFVKQTMSNLFRKKQ